jgi:hypothetical protein
MSFYKKKEDEIYLPIIQTVVDKRPTYGYKRITSLVNRILKSNNEPSINRKRVYRIMKINTVLLQQTWFYVIDIIDFLLINDTPRSLMGCV